VKTEILYGIHPVQEALKAGRRKFYEIYLARDNPAGRLDNILKITEDRNIAVTNSLNQNSFQDWQKHPSTRESGPKYRFIPLKN
jgi:23S rRNA (guanosine2251-2'-O)-methyltransferase